MPYRAIARRVIFGPTLVIGLCVLAAGGWAFGALAEEVAEGDTGLDNCIADELHEHVTHLPDGVLRGRDDPRQRNRPAGVAAIAAPRTEALATPKRC